mmetsp:Transcript_19039/g.32585  ORF Transcript_19039/g.32585 Transcript_19039/m.32585 type:complete len:217 (-) Transcript_19039:647-1297(-)
MGVPGQRRRQQRGAENVLASVLPLSFATSAAWGPPQNGSSSRRTMRRTRSSKTWVLKLHAKCLTSTRVSCESGPLPRSSNGPSETRGTRSGTRSVRSASAVRPAATTRVGHAATSTARRAPRAPRRAKVRGMIGAQTMRMKTAARAARRSTKAAGTRIGTAMTEMTAETMTGKTRIRMGTAGMGSQRAERRASRRLTLTRRRHPTTTLGLNRHRWP